MAWVKDWTDIGVGLGELRADVGEYIDEIWEATFERLYVSRSGIGFGSGLIPDLPIDSGVTPTVDDWHDRELFVGNVTHAFSLRSVTDGAPDDVNRTLNKCVDIQENMDRMVDATSRGQIGGQSGFIDYRFLSGSFEDQSVFPSYWTEASLLADIGDPLRFIFPGAAELIGWGETAENPLDTWQGLRPWLKQQYEILNRLIWTAEGMGDTGAAAPASQTRKRGRSGSQATQALATSVGEADYFGDPIIPKPGFDPAVGAQTLYFKTHTGAGTFFIEIDTYETTMSLSFGIQGGYITMLTDWYIQATTIGGTVTVYDNNGDAGIHITDLFYEKQFADLAIPLATPLTLGPSRTGAHNLPAPNAGVDPPISSDNGRGYLTRNTNFTGGAGFVTGDSFIIAKWNLAKML